MKLVGGVVLTNIHFLQLHEEAWVRFVVVSIITVIIYAFYGQYHANPISEGSGVYFRVPG